MKRLGLFKKKNKNIETVKAIISPFFDKKYYLDLNPDVEIGGVDPLQHYALHGWKEGRDPSKEFSTSFYLEHNADVVNAGVNPLYHYVTRGRLEGRAPAPEGFAGRNPNAAALHPDIHRLKILPRARQVELLRAEGVEQTYRDLQPDINKVGIDAIEHYLTYGWLEGRRPLRWFDTKYYLGNHPELIEHNICPLLHYLLVGKANGETTLKPNAPAVMEALAEIGIADDTWCELFHAPDYVALNGLEDEGLEGDEALVHFIRNGLERGAIYNLDRTFDPAFYRGFYPDLDLADNRAAARHWFNGGYREGRLNESRLLLRRHGIQVPALPEAFLAEVFGRPTAGQVQDWRRLDDVLGTLHSANAYPSLFKPAYEPALRLVVRGRLFRGDHAGGRAICERMLAAGLNGDETRELHATSLQNTDDVAGASRIFFELRERLSHETQEVFLNNLVQQKKWNDVLVESKRILAALPHNVVASEALHKAIDHLFAQLHDRGTEVGADGDRQAAFELGAESCALAAGQLDANAARATPHRISGIRNVAIYTDCTLPQCLFYRVHQKAEHLAAADIACSVFIGDAERTALLQDVRKYDAVIFYRIGGSPRNIDLIRQVRSLGIVTFYEIDDLIFDHAIFPDSFESYGNQISRRVYGGLIVGTAHIQAAMSLCDYGLASTPALAAEMQRFMPNRTVFVHRNAFGKLHGEIATLSSRTTPLRPVTLFYGTGTKAHNSDFDDLLAPALAEIFRKHEQSVRLVIVGYLTLPEVLAPYRNQIVMVEPIWDYGRYWRFLGEEADINLSVLGDTLVNGCKSEIKWLEAAMFGIPSVVSATATYRDLIEPGVDGFVAAEMSDWLSALENLISDRALRHAVGRAAMEKAGRDYNMQAMAANLKDIFAKVVDEVVPTERTKPRMRVAVVNVFYPPFRIGGATRVVEDNVQDLMRKYGDHIEIEVFTSISIDPDSPKSDVWSSYYLLNENESRSYIQDGIPVTVHGVILHKDGEMRIDNPGAKAGFAKFLDRFSPHVVHFHCIQRLTTSIAEAAIEAGIPYFVTLHDGWWISPNQFILDHYGVQRYYANDNPIQNFIDGQFDARPGVALHRYDRSRALMFALRRAERVFAVSDSFAELHRAHGIPAETMPNGVSHFGPRERTKSPDGKVRIGFIGGMAPHKGYSLIRAVLRTSELRNIELFVTDDLLHPGTSYRETWGGTTVTFIPKVPSSEVASLYASIDVLLAPSIWPESFGLVTREAMASGVWVITSDRGALHENVVEGENGFVVDVSSIAGLRDVLTGMDADPERFLSPPKVAAPLRRAEEQADELARIYLSAPARGPWEPKVQFPDRSAYPWAFRRPDRSVSTEPRILRDVLHAVIGGFEHSGTTMVSEIVRQHPDLDSSFEGGMLLNETPRAFPETQPFFDNLCDTWSLSEEKARAVMDTDSFLEAFVRLREASPVIKDKTVKLFDKTPRYMAHMPRILEKVDVPALCMVRDFRSLLWSSFRRTKMSMDDWLETTYPITMAHTKRYCVGAARALKQHGAHRLMIVQYEELCLNQMEMSKKICEHLGLDFDQTMLSFENKRFNLVHDNQIETAYIHEYRETMPLEVQKRILDDFADFADWTYNG